MRRLLLSFSVCIAVISGARAAGQQPGVGSAPSPLSSSWRQIVTPDFIVTGNAPAEELKRTLGEITRFRDSLARLFPGAVVESPVPTYVVVLRNFVDFLRFQPRDSRGKRQQNVGGYFSRKPDANLIVLPGARGEVTLQTIFHEYTHYFVSRNVRTPVPTWLNEGLADFYSTFRGDFKGRTLIGAVPPYRAGALGSIGFIPLRDIISPRDVESMWRSDRQIAMFYAESWALVHYLMMERKHPVPEPLQTYLKSFAKSGNHDTAFMEAFGTDIDGMDKELRSYIRRVSVKAVVLDMQLDKSVSTEASRISEADVNALEGRLMLEAGALEDAERELTASVKQQPAHAAAQITLARLRLEQDREDDAITSLQEVVASSPENGAAHYYLGVALERAWRHEEAIAVFTKTLKLMPRNPAPWSGLNSAAIALGRDVQAAAALQNALQVEWSPSYYWTQGLHAMRLGRDDLAAASLATYLELRGTGEDQSVYPLFVRALAAWRAARPSEAEAALAIAEQANPPQEWTRTVLRYLQGRLDEAQFMRSAGDIGEQTEARTYAAFKLALAGRESEAIAHFQWVAERGAKTYIEYELARNELNRLKYRNQGPIESRSRD
jgi:tetratricopeptide (TPR) repeat protein